MWCTACRWKKACQRFTDWSSPAARQTNKPCSFPAEENKGKRGGGVILHAFGFLQINIATVCQLWPRPRSPAPSHTPPNLISSTEPFQLWKQPQDGRVTFHIAVRDSQRGLAIPFFPSFWENLGAAKQCKEKKRFLQFFCFLFLMLGSVLHLSMFCTALVFKWKSCQRRGLRKRPNDFFFFFKCVFSQKIRVKNTFLFKRRRELSEVRFKKAMKKHVEVKLAVFVLPSTCSSLCIQFWTLRWSFITVPHASRTAPRECMRGIAGKGWWTVGKEEEETHTYTNTHEMNDQCKKRKRKKKEQIKQKIQLPVRESRWTIRVIYTQTRFLLTQSKADHVDLYSLFLCFTRDVILKRAKQTSSLKCMQHYLNSFYLSWQLCNRKLQNFILSFTFCFGFFG